MNPIFTFFVDYNYPIEQLSSELFHLTPAAQLEIKADSSCGGNHQVNVFAANDHELELIKRYSNGETPLCNECHKDAEGGRAEPDGRFFCSSCYYGRN